MIDLHTHILPGIDDGSRSMEETLAMLDIAANDGTEIVVATPHVITGEFLPQKKDILEAVEQLNRELDIKGIPIHVKPGAEVRLEPDLSERQSRGELMTLNDTGRYLLVELPTEYIPDYTYKVLYDLQLQGIIPILAHPERNIGFNNNPHVLLELVSRGILVQITTGSLTGLFGRNTQKTTMKLLQDGCVHAIATDMHSLQGRRKPTISPAYNQLQKQFGPEFAEVLTRSNPARILKGEKIIPVTPRLRGLRVTPGRC